MSLADYEPDGSEAELTYEEDDESPTPEAGEEVEAPEVAPEQQQAEGPAPACEKRDAEAGEEVETAEVAPGQESAQGNQGADFGPVEKAPRPAGDYRNPNLRPKGELCLNCGKPMDGEIRGLCKVICYLRAYRQVEGGKTTWEELELAGKAKPLVVRQPPRIRNGKREIHTSRLRQDSDLARIEDEKPTRSHEARTRMLGPGGLESEGVGARPNSG